MRKCLKNEDQEATVQNERIVCCVNGRIVCCVNEIIVCCAIIAIFKSFVNIEIFCSDWSTENKQNPKINEPLKTLKYIGG